MLRSAWCYVCPNAHLPLGQEGWEGGDSWQPIHLKAIHPPSHVWEEIPPKHCMCRGTKRLGGGQGVHEGGCHEAFV
eukprot:1145581-Pelagomonas_calceolata.AAC.4